MLFNLGEFGDGNPYTVVSHDLKSVITATPNAAWGSFNLVGSGLPPIVDPVLGTKFQDVNGDDAGYRFTTMAASLAQTHYEGHIKIKVQKGWLCGGEASFNGNSGDVLQNTEKFMSCLAASGPTTALGILNNSGSANATVYMPGAVGTIQCNLDFRNHVIGAYASSIIHTAGKDDFVEVDIFWKGKYGFFAVDGVIINATDQRSTTGATPWVNIMNNTYLGSDRGVAGTYCRSHYFQDYEIRTKCPEFSLNYKHRRIGFLSDSIVDSQPVSANTAGDVSAQFRIQRVLNKKGQYCNINISENGGYHVFNTGSGQNWLGYDSAVPDLAGNTPIVSALANDPIEVLVCAGTNDAIYSGTEITAAQFTAAAMDILEKLLGENGNPATSVELVKWIIPIPLWGVRNNASYVAWLAKAAEFRAELYALPALWDATYPSRAGALILKDSFEALGRESAVNGTDLYQGDLQGTGLNLHLGAHGMQVFGDFLAEDY